MRTAKTLIRLGGCTGWSESSLGAQFIFVVVFFSCWLICDCVCYWINKLILLFLHETINLFQFLVEVEFTCIWVGRQVINHICHVRLYLLIQFMEGRHLVESRMLLLQLKHNCPECIFPSPKKRQYTWLNSKHLFRRYGDKTKFWHQSRAITLCKLN